MKTKLFFATILVALFCSVDSFAQNAKYHSEYDLGYSIGVGDWAIDRINFQTIQGVELGDYFSTGLGVGVDYYYDAESFVLPITLNAKGYLPISDKVSPFVSLDLGYGMDLTDDMSGFLFTPAIGLKAGKFKVQVGYNSQKFSESGVSVSFNSVQVKLGVMF